MRILQVNKFFYIKGGSERVFFNTIQVLENAGHKVICFSMKDERNFPSDYTKYFINNIEFQKSRSYWQNIRKAVHFLYSWEARKKLEKLIIETKPEIAHLHNFSHQLTVSILSILQKYNIPIVQTLHDYQLICPNYRLFTQGNVCQRCKRQRYYQAIIHRCVRNSYWLSALSSLELYWQRLFHLYRERVAVFIAPSLFLKQIMQAWGIKNKIVHIPYYLEIPADNEINHSVGDYLLYFGRLSSEKGLMTLLRAMRYLPKISLKIVGKGPVRPFLAEFIRKKKINNVQLLGERHGVALNEIIKHCRFVVVPSEWYENYPMAILEAMGWAKPVLGSNIGGIPEMIIDNENGWLFFPKNVNDLREKINLIYFNEELIRKCGYRARQTVEQKNCSTKYYQQLIKIYQQVLSKN